MRRFVVLCLLLTAPAVAQRVSEPGTGLSVEAPAGYRAALVTARPPNTVAIAVRRPEDGDTGCQVAYRPAPQNERYSQAELNQTVAGEVWRGEAVRAVNAIYTVDHTEPFRHAGIEGLLLEGMVRMRQGVPARAKDVRTLFVILETPRGRTSAVCVGERVDFARRREEFIRIIRSTTPPSQAMGRPASFHH